MSNKRHLILKYTIKLHFKLFTLLNLVLQLFMHSDELFRPSNLYILHFVIVNNVSGNTRSHQPIAAGALARMSPCVILDV